MKSKITIDINDENQPVIKIDFVPTEDIRDKLIEKFLDSHMLQLSICSLNYQLIEESNKEVKSRVLISPINKGKEFEEIERAIDTNLYRYGFRETLKDQNNDPYKGIDEKIVSNSIKYDLNIEENESFWRKRFMEK